MEFVRGWRQIGDVFGVAVKVVKQWENEGAPILILGDKPVTRFDDLWYWLVEKKKDASNI